VSSIRPGRRVISSAGAPDSSPEGSAATKRGEGTSLDSSARSVRASASTTSGACSDGIPRWTYRRTTSRCRAPRRSTMSSACTALATPPVKPRTPVTWCGAAPTARADYARTRSGRASVTRRDATDGRHVPTAISSRRRRRTQPERVGRHHSKPQVSQGCSMGEHSGARICRSVWHARRSRSGDLNWNPPVPRRGSVRALGAERVSLVCRGTQFGVEDDVRHRSRCLPRAPVSCRTRTASP
jgi:hypothetical protein